VPESTLIDTLESILKIRSPVMDALLHADSQRFLGGSSEGLRMRLASPGPGIETTSVRTNHKRIVIWIYLYYIPPNNQGSSDTPRQLVGFRQTRIQLVRM